MELTGKEENGEEISARGWGVWVLVCRCYRDRIETDLDSRPNGPQVWKASSLNRRSRFVA